MKYSYPALRILQGSSDKPLVIFSAKAVEIEKWSGVPQKRKIGEDIETTGYQRELNQKRLVNLKKFFANSDNIIQNPLLAALRGSSGSIIEFVANSAENSSEHAILGELTIDVEDFESKSLLSLLGMLREQMESRVPELEGRVVAESELVKARERLKEISDNVDVIETEVPDDIGESDSDEGPANSDLEAEDSESALFEESHITDFWNDVAIRHELLKELGTTFVGESILGFSKDFLIESLKPIVIVDGQHRLNGALAALDDKVNSTDLQDEVDALLETALADDPDLILKELKNKYSRTLPISLLLNTSPSEQVFQFVIVNQKATPIGKALLGTIVSTTLSNEELGEVQQRLEDAGIELNEAQAITKAAKHPDSPFVGLVERGLAGGAQTDLLKWSVLGLLVNIFKDLENAKLFGGNVDWAIAWKEKYLETSKILDDFEAKGFDSRAEYWSDLNGVWFPVFCKFFSCIRDEFGSVDDPESANYWGKPRTSNLFNKISLMILAADFFQSLKETKQGIDSVDSIPGLVESWLEDVKRTYFARKWPLEGVKKDSKGIREQWAVIWQDYRKSPNNLPRITKYRISAI